MMDESEEIAGLLQRTASGDRAAADQLFSRYARRLKRMVRLRLSQHLRGRVDSSDILQEAYLEAGKRLPDYLAQRPLPFFLWLRHITGQKLIDAHRRHLGAQRRDASCEVSLHCGRMPAADSTPLAAHLLGSLTTPSQAAIKAEARILVQEALDAMDPLDREVLALRHFEHLSNVETAEALEINESTASTRYLRALKRLREALARVPGLLDD